MQNNRIEVLDSFRGIAILMVIFFHFFSRWSNLYPYQSQYDFFRYGKFGVHFFFMISGFVIFFTLEKTKSLAQFWFNRFIRLLPSMFFASIITCIFFNLFDDNFLFPATHYVKNIFVSLTFIQPDLLSKLTGYSIELDYISGSYWSLWLEIQFYVLASFFYFLSPKKFYSYFFIAAVFLVVFNFLLSHIYIDNFIVSKLKSLRSAFNLLDSLSFFSLGAIFYVLYKNNSNKVKNSVFEIGVFAFFLFFLVFTNYQDLKKLSLFILFNTLFLLMIYYPKAVAFLNNRILNSIGVASYFLYLIHENIGVFLIHKNYISISLLPFLAPLFYMLVLISVSIFFTTHIERKIIAFLKKLYKF